MLLRFIRPFRHYAPGEVIDAPAGQADIFIRRGFAIPADAPKPEPKRKPEQSDKPRTQAR